MQFPFSNHVNNNTSILFGRFDEFLWIRCSGRGSFSNSPVVKSLGDDYIASGGRLIVIDLETCSGIDSTFMGTLAGLARRLMPMGGAVQIAFPSERCLCALEGLGLDALLSIEPPAAPWRGKVDLIRASLDTESVPDVSLDAKGQTLHVLNSHLTLSELSEENEEKFRNVTDCLKEELKRQGDQ